MTTIWLRAETKPGEARCALTPEHTRALVERGFDVFVERSAQRALPEADYAAAGCKLMPAGSWQQAPAQAYILGLKDLPPTPASLVHRHIYFGHAYKQQAGWRGLLGRFIDGGGELLDMEYLVDESGRRVAAFGYWAGFAGCAVAVKAWSGQQRGNDPSLAGLVPYRDKNDLISDLKDDLARTPAAAGDPSVIVVGAKGRVGSGACDVADMLGLPVTRWDIEETRGGGPFEEILRHDIFVNCVLVNAKIPPFVTLESLARPGRKLSVISDVSCDPGEYNPVPIYSQPTTFSSPVLRVLEHPPLDLTAIDHLPSLLPVEASRDFGDQLLPHLLRLGSEPGGVWAGAREVFRRKTKELLQHNATG